MPATRDHCLKNVNDAKNFKTSRCSSPTTQNYHNKTSTFKTKDFMKKPTYLFFACLLFSVNSAIAQTEQTQSKEPKFGYCELVGTQKLFSQKLTIAVDFGEAKNIWKDNRVKDEVTGKVQVFNSMVDALNYMGEDGWEFVQAYIVTLGQQNVYHWLLKKQKLQ
jgi:hypothetical protein